MKKILIIAPQFYPIPAVKDGAVEWLITYLINQNELNKKAQFYIVSKYDKEAKKIKHDMTKIYYVKNTESLPFKFIKLVRKLVFNRYTKFIWKKADYKELTYFGFFCNKIARKVKPDLIVSEGYDKIHNLWPIIKWFPKENFFYHLHYSRSNNELIRKDFPNTIAVSDFVLKKWELNSSFKGKSIVIKNGIDLKRFSNKTGNAKEVSREELGCSQDDFIVLFTGRFRPGKGLIELLNSFSKITDPHIKLLLLGDFVAEAKENEKQFEKDLRIKIKRNKNVIHLGFVPYETIQSYYRISNMQIVPSIYDEAAGLVAVEGMSMGLPLVITNSGGMPEYTGNKCAIILERDDHLQENIAKSILMLKENSQLCQKMSIIGKERAKNFSIESFYINYMNFLLGEEAAKDE